jgi:hypothetical protein
VLKLAIEAEIPLIAVSTRDVMNLHVVMEEVTGKKPQTWQAQIKLEEGQVYTHICSPKQELPLTELYGQFTKAKTSLVLVNPVQVKEPMYNAGELLVPRSLIKKLLMHVVEDTKRADELLRGLGGCTIKEAAELIRLTMARDASLTVDGIMETRRSGFQGANGLTPVDSKQDFYKPPKTLLNWLLRERSEFLLGTDPRLMPRGLLFDGPPGTGKTSGAKWLADQLGVPLYRLDIGGTKSKWVGESEGKLLQNLSRIDNEEPAVVLLDEVEKIFSTGHNDASGTTSAMLSQLLWWLAERRSRILVVMTTNDAKSLPKELYRAGRIDDVIWMTGLEKPDAMNFITDLMKTFKKEVPIVNESEVLAALKVASAIPGTQPEVYAQAALTKAVYERVKFMKKMTNSKQGVKS